MERIAIESLNLNPYATNLQPQGQDFKENALQQETNKILSGSKRGLEEKPDLKEEQVITAIEKANKKLSNTKNEFSFSVHEKTKQIMVKVINKDTKEVIREFPPEKILDMVATMWETAGLFVDQKR